MKRRIARIVFVMVSGTLVWCGSLFPEHQQGTPSEGSEITLTVRTEPLREVAHSRTRPMREIAARYAPKRRKRLLVKDDQPSLPDRKYQRLSDGALQTTASASTIKIGPTFDGLPADGVAPPDPNGAVGTTQFVEVVNDEYAVYDKTGSGTPIIGPVDTNALWSSLQGTPCQTDNDGDATITFDKLAKRWVIQQFTSKPPFYICTAVSTSEDATGTWNAYAMFNFTSTYFPDYPKLGTWPVAYPGFPQGVYLLSASIHAGNPGPYNGPVVCFMDRGAMLAGLSAGRSQCYGLPPEFNALIPSDLDGTRAPPNGEPGIFMTWDPNGSQVDMLKLTPCYPNCSTVTALPLSAPSFTPYFAIAGHGPNCTHNGVTRNGPGSCDIPEASGDGTYLDSVSDKPMYRLAYRNGGHLEFLVFTHTVLGVVNGRNQVAAVRWYQIRDPGTRPIVSQAGTFAPDYQWRWMGSTAMDGFGDQAIGYSLSETQISGHPGPMIALTGREWNDPPNTVQNESIVLTNNFYQNGGLTRWGDYSSMQVDPVDDCTFWYTAEYVKQTGPGFWGTHIVTFKFPSCQ
jgi:hypothetical protein